MNKQQVELNKAQNGSVEKFAGLREEEICEVPQSRQDHLVVFW